MDKDSKKIKYKKGKLMILDGNALIHRSFHALPPTMATKKGEITNAVYGFTTVLIKAMREFRPDYIALTLDKAAPTFRHKEYKEYKATRIKAPDELYGQFPRVKEIARVFNIPIYEKDGFEADDLIGTIVAEADGNIEKIIVTGDLDTLQLVNEHTKVYTMKRGLTDSMIYDQQAVKQRYGLNTNQMIDYKALRGDPSDNIPGIRGIGDKTAVELLQQFKTLENVYKNIDSKKIKGRISGLLKEHKKDALMSKKLATIKCDVKIKFKLEDAELVDFDQKKIVKLFSELEFKSLLPRIRELGIENQKLGEKGAEAMDKFKRNEKMFRYYLIDDDKKFKKFLTSLKQQKEFAFDTETADLNSISAELLGVSFSWRAGEAYYVKTTDDKRQTTDDNLFNYRSGIPAMGGTSRNSRNERDKQKAGIRNQRLKKLKSILENSKIKKFGHNIKYDIKVMACYGINVKGVEFDTMIASYLLNPGTRQHNLDILTFNEFGHQKISKEDLQNSAFAASAAALSASATLSADSRRPKPMASDEAMERWRPMASDDAKKATADKKGLKRKNINFAEVDAEKLSNYSCEDADFTYRLAKKLLPELKKQKLYKLFKEIEMPLILVLAEMEMNGIMLDSKFLNALSKKVNEKINKLTIKIYKQAGKKFNINSTQQLREILFEKLSIPTNGITKTKTGFSTAADELAKLKDLHPIIKLIQEYRELAKLSSTYIDALPKLVNSKTGRLHTSFNQSVTATGRLSSTEPNLQNIPIRTELGREVRQAFIADKGYKLLSLDYSQIELRLTAHMSNDKKMIKAFANGADIHQITAAEINQILPDAVTKEMRRQAKAINFGILYGQGPHGLAQGADIPYWRAKEFIEQYFIVYKDVKKFIDKTIDQARQNGYVETLLGRRRYLPEINSSILQVRKAAERMAVNAPVQGTAADMIKMAMIAVGKQIATNSITNSHKTSPQPSPWQGEGVRMLLQVHDELLFEVKKEMVEEAAEKIKKIMENVIELKVPIVVDVKVGDNWGKMREAEINYFTVKNRPAF